MCPKLMLKQPPSLSQEAILLMYNGQEIITQEDLLDSHGLLLLILIVMLLSMLVSKKFIATKSVDVDLMTLVILMEEILLLLMEVQDLVKQLFLYLSISLTVLGLCNGHGLVERSNWATTILALTTRSLEDLLLALRKMQFFMEEITAIPTPRTSASFSILIGFMPA